MGHGVMVEHAQINVRVPLAGRELIKRVAKDIREVPGFRERLERWLSEGGGDERTDFLTARLERLEARFAELARMVGAGSVPAGISTPAAARQQEMFPAPAAQTVPRSTKAPAAAGRAGEDQGEVWAQGEGRGRRLTPAGKAELARRLAAGETNREIAEALGIRPNAVANARKA